jgi:outer membrane protein assembly factor BamB
VGSPVVAGRVVYFGAGDGILRAADLDSGRLLWQSSLGMPITGAPALAGDALIVTTVDGLIYAFTSQLGGARSGTLADKGGPGPSDRRPGHRPR